MAKIAKCNCARKNIPATLTEKETPGKAVILMRSQFTISIKNRICKNSITRLCLLLFYEFYKDLTAFIQRKNGSQLSATIF